MIYGIYAAIASFGFALLFNIKKDKLWAASLCGLSGGITYSTMLLFNDSVALALFISSLVLTTLSYLFAYKLHAPVTTFLIVALIPLVPGGGMYYTMLEIIQGTTTTALQLGLNTLIQASSIVIGVTSISSLHFLLTSLKKSIN